MIFLQRPNKKAGWMRSQVIPLLEEKLKNLSQPNIETYIKKIINLELTTTGHQTLFVIQAKKVLEFLEGQENISKVQPQLLYKLIERIIHDVKENGNETMTPSKLFEKYRIDGLIG